MEWFKGYALYGSLQFLLLYIFVYTLLGHNFKGAAYVLLRIIDRKSRVLSTSTPDITCNECI